MSIYLKGDGRIYSSIAFTTITLPNQSQSPEILEDNVEIVESEAGYNESYQKGNYRRVFPYRFTLLTQTQKDILWDWWVKIKGQSHWFLLQPQDQVFNTGITSQYYCGTYMGQNTCNKWLFGATDSEDFLAYRGFWSFILDGNCKGERRRITKGGWHTPPFPYAEVYPFFSNDIILGTQFIIGYPVMLEGIRFEATPRIPNFWDVELVFKEKIIDRT